MQTDLSDLSRPLPPEDLWEEADGSDFSGLFVPDPGLSSWIRATFIDPAGPLFNPDHAHLADASIGAIWTAWPLKKRGKLYAGTAEIPRLQGSSWGSVRGFQQLALWFGCIPDFVHTYYAPGAAGSPNDSWCALVEHELYHCGQALDEDGIPRFDPETGLPKWTIFDHDVEEFVGVWRRYGPGAAAGLSSALFAAALQPPLISPVRVAAACGTCAGRR